MATATWNRGREAKSPREIPATGWKDILMRVKKEIKEDRLSIVSAAMAYFALFALVPAITSIILIYAWISDPSEIAQHFSKLSNVLPAEMQKIISGQLISLASKASSSLGAGAIFSLLVSLWSAAKGSKALMEALNIIYDENDERGFFKQNIIAIALTFFWAILSIVAIGVVVGIPAIVSQFEFGKLIESAVASGSWIILLVLYAVFLQVAYRYGPHRTQAKWKWVSTGAIIASVLWALASLLFSWYATKFGNFNKTYGSLGAVVVMMLWFYITSFVILIGGEINAELEHQTKKDTTVGNNKPMGQRGARMADTLGESYGKNVIS